MIRAVALLTLLTATLPASAEVRVDQKPMQPGIVQEIERIPVPAAQVPNRRQIVRDIVMELASYAKARRTEFIVLARNGTSLFTKGDWEAKWEELRDPEGLQADQRLPRGTVQRDYVRALDGLVLDGFYCAAAKAPERTATPPQQVQIATKLMTDEGRRIFALDACGKYTPAMAAKAANAQIALFTANPAKKLIAVPAARPPFENAGNVVSLQTVRNYLPLLSSTGYATRADWVGALRETNYDALIIDPFHRGDDPLTAAEVAALKYKKLGSQRLVLAAMSIGRAADDRFYWRKGWAVGAPAWLAAPDPADPAAILTDLQSSEWKGILGQTIKGIMDLGFDGVMFDDLDTFAYFEGITPLEE